MTIFWRAVVVLGCAAWLAAGCAGQVGTSAERQCSEGLDLAYQELKQAKVDGFGDTVTWSKAAGLLAAASVQKQLEQFPDCTDKVRRARAYLATLRR